MVPRFSQEAVAFCPRNGSLNKTLRISNLDQLDLELDAEFFSMAAAEAQKAEKPSKKFSKRSANASPKEEVTTISKAELEQLIANQKPKEEVVTISKAELERLLNNQREVASPQFPAKSLTSSLNSLNSSLRAPSMRFSTMSSSSSSTVETQRKVPHKVKLCRHFLRGTCDRGHECNFLHDISVFKPDDQKLFLGGVPRNATPQCIVAEMKNAGFKVINEPQVMSRGFCPKVCMDSIESAQKLINGKRVQLFGKSIDVRAYMNMSDKTVQERTINLGRVPANAEAKDIVAAFEKLGYTVEEPTEEDMQKTMIPVVMQTTDMANAMSILERIKILGKTVDLVQNRIMRQPQSVNSSMAPRSLTSSMRSMKSMTNSFNTLNSSIRSTSSRFGSFGGQKKGLKSTNSRFARF